MRRMDRISGRSDDMLIIRGVNVFPSQLEEEIVEFEHLSPHYQLEVNRRGHLDSLSVKVEWKESSLTLTHEQHCQVCHQLRHRIKSMVGISTDVISLTVAVYRVQKARRVGCLICAILLVPDVSSGPWWVKPRPEVDTTCAMIHKSQR